MKIHYVISMHHMCPFVPFPYFISFMFIGWTSSSHCNHIIFRILSYLVLIMSLVCHCRKQRKTDRISFRTARKIQPSFLFFFLISAQFSSHLGHCGHAHRRSVRFSAQTFHPFRPNLCFFFLLLLHLLPIIIINFQRKKYGNFLRLFLCLLPVPSTYMVLCHLTHIPVCGERAHILKSHQ